MPTNQPSLPHFQPSTQKLNIARSSESGHYPPYRGAFFWLALF